MSKRTQQRFAPHGALAVHPKAFGALFDEVTASDTPPINDGAGGVAIVPIRGPLMLHPDHCFDSYTAIKARFRAAIDDGARMIVMSIDSPGGLVSGAFDTARELRAMCAEAGVELRAHVEAQATSAAYAMATAASWIGVSRSASIGSIGVIDTMIDVTAQNQAMGINVQLITSGARKADGNPNAALSSEALDASQARVDDLAAMFFELVVDHGWGGNVANVEALQASVVNGGQAVALGLASDIATLAETIAFDTLGSDEAKATETRKAETHMAEPMEDAVASLRKMAEDGDEEESKKARAALKALGAEGFEDDEEAEDAPDDEEAKAEDDEDAPDEAKAEEDKDEDMSASAHALAMKALTQVHNMKAAAAKEKQSAERATLLASRPDFAPEMVAILSSPATPLATVRKMCADLAKGPTRSDRVAAAATVTGTRGEAQGDGFASRLPPEQKAALDLQMGLTKMTAETVNDAHRLTFGARRPVAANAAKGK